MQVMYDDYAPHGFVTISINLGESMDSVVKVYARRFTFLSLRDPGSVWPIYQQHNAIPLNYVIDTAGTIRYWEEGFNESTIRQYIQQYLPDPIRDDVGAARIVAPIDNVDSGATVVPACTVFNAGANAATFPVRMSIGTDYDTFAVVSNLAPGERRYVTLPGWTAGARRLTVPVRCTTELAGDDIQSNNLATAYVNIRVYDFATMAILAPGESLDSAATVTPSAVVKNLGSIPDMVKAKFFIGTDYVDSASVPLQPGRSDTVNLRAWTPLQSGSYAVRCTVIGRSRNDLNPANDRLTSTVYVRPGGIEAQPGAAARFALDEPRPNPSSGPVRLQYSLARASTVTLRIYDVGGRRVRTLESAPKPAGPYTLLWNGRNDLDQPISRGVYYCRLTADEQQAMHKLIVR